MGQNKEIKNRKIQHWQIVAIVLAVYDAIAVNLAYFLALWLRYDCSIESINNDYCLTPFIQFIPFYALFCLIVFNKCGLYRSMWRFASFMELERIVIATGITFVIQVVGIEISLFLPHIKYNRMPFSYYLAGVMFQFFFIVTARFSYRFMLLFKGSRKQYTEELTPILLIGAGSAGRAIIREVNRIGQTRERIVSIIDDDKNTWGRSIDGVHIIGGRDEILSAVKKYKCAKIYIAIPSASSDEKRDILNICKETDCELKLLRDVYKMVDENNISVADLESVSIEDLLGREPIRVDMTEIYEFISGKVIMVTGGGGSIGSELCRQIAKHGPKQLIIFDVYENNAYAIEQEIRRIHPDLNMKVLIGSVRDSRRLDQIFDEYKPEIVYHAAAHKHVPLMEESPVEAIKNNAIGTYKTAYAAMTHGCDRFVLISTDKAVNPTNIMGASKRLCEMVIQTFDAMVKAGKTDLLPKIYTHDDSASPEDRKGVKEGVTPHTEYVAVRFGNVLGSNGSVVPLFKEQIAEGGPVTVTHPDIIRYFMTIPEAVSLVMQAGTYAKGGEIFVLDMGSPVKIDTLARNLIRLSGLKPDEDIKIVYTGLRPGEKMYEEKLMAEEGMGTTPNHLIHIGNPLEFDREKFIDQLEDLMDAAYAGSPDIREKVAAVVKTYHPE
ncbi:MAG: UDP-N-acetyl-alpha-D-glucosamine C6 dehydratase [Firmicutes bacterium ADurb.Bin354]|nr:MAG: UDP-N-acetyl-alpha-D-glucosamine C6 dehydratase [Firmicutes bacterium ADurb.Bin354]